MHWIYWIIALIAASLISYRTFKKDKAKALPYPWLTAMLRGTLFLSVSALLLLPRCSTTKEVLQKPKIMLLMDESQSVAANLKSDTVLYRQQMQNLIQALGKDYTLSVKGFGEALLQDSLFAYRQSATNIADALQETQDYMSDQAANIIILASDGKYNSGANPLYQKINQAAAFYVVGIGDSVLPKDLRIADVYANKRVVLNNRFEVRVDVAANACEGYTNSLQLLDANGERIQSSDVRIDKKTFSRTYAFTIDAKKAGLQHYKLVVPVADGEANTGNNSKDFFVEVIEDKKEIALIGAAPHPDMMAIKSAMEDLPDYTISVYTKADIPKDWSRYRAVVLHGLPDAATLPNIPAALPVWYIVSAQTQLPALNQVQQAVRFEAAPVLQDVHAALNAGFRGFVLPIGAHAVIEKMPPLLGTGGTVKAAPDAELLLQKKHTNIPVWILQNDQVPKAVLAAEGLWRWRMYEYKNTRQFKLADELVKQTIAFLTTNQKDKPFSISTPKHIWSDQEPVLFSGTLYNASRQAVTTSDVRFTIVDAGGAKKTYPMDKISNRYQLNAGLWAAGKYNYMAEAQLDGKTYTEQGAFVVSNTPLEYMESGSDYAFLYNLATQYQGELVPYQKAAEIAMKIKNNPAIKPVLVSETETKPVIDKKWLFVLLLLIAATEWLLRKYWMGN